MNADADRPVVGLDIPAEVGMDLEQVQTPALIVDLEVFERNVATLRDRLQAAGVRLRAHAKTHRSVDIARYQIEHGGACGICCQKVAEAEVMVAGGIGDVLVSNQVVDAGTIERLARLARTARLLVCVDDAGNVDALSAAALRHGVQLECLVEIDYGARRAAIDAAARQARATVEMLAAAGLDCGIVAGAGTGSYVFEAGSGLYNEMQCGSYVFMDADYQRVLDDQGTPICEFGNALFVWTSVMSNARDGFAVCDAGLKVMSLDSGLPVIDGRDGVEYVNCSDEHGVIADPRNSLQLNDKLKLIPGHCDPTCNLHDWYVGIRDRRVECLWPVSARGKSL